MCYQIGLGTILDVGANKQNTSLSTSLVTFSH